MWRRACLGVHDDAATLFMLWTGVVLDVLLLGADRLGWARGLMLATAVGTLMQAVYWWRRRRWDRLVERELEQVLEEARILLRRRRR